jgi:hypothetical protein
VSINRLFHIFVQKIETKLEKIAKNFDYPEEIDNKYGKIEVKMEEPLN